MILCEKQIFPSLTDRKTPRKEDSVRAVNPKCSGNTKVTPQLAGSAYKDNNFISYFFLNSFCSQVSE